MPQLINVLIGDMSLVGPRPELPEFVAIWPSETREIVLSVRPGITDEAAIKYRNEGDLLADQEDPLDFYERTLMPDKLAMYVRYVTNRSVFGDIRILGETGRALLEKRR